MIKMAETEYQFKGNPIIQGVPVIGNLVYDERGQEILAVHNERFKGISKIEDTTDYKKGQPISFSNAPRILSYAQILRERFPDMHVLSPEEVVINWDIIPERNETYADTNSIVIYPNLGTNETLRKRALDLTGKKLKKTPLVVSGLGVKRDDDLGFNIFETEYMNAKFAPWLKQDGWVKYSQERGELVSCKQEDEGAVRIVVPDDQSGLRGLCRGGSGRLSAGVGGLLGSGDAGRVQVLYDPQGRRTENLEGRIRELQEERERLKQEIDSRFPNALEYLKTGKFQ